jgi:hypothetical protein
MTTIIALKLTSGEEIIGKVKATPSASMLSAQEAFNGANNNDYFNPATGFKLPEIVTLSQVRGVHLQQGPDGNVGVTLIPWAISNPNADVTINLRDAALAVLLPAPKLEDAYVQQTSSIQLASAMPRPQVLNG